MAWGPARQINMPDVLVQFRGLRLAIEGEVDDQNQARGRAVTSAMARVERGLVHLGIAVVYPSTLRTVNFAELDTVFSNAVLEYAVVSEYGDEEFASGTVRDLEHVLRRSFDQLVAESIVERAAAALDAGVDAFAQNAFGDEGTIGRWKELLGIWDVSDREQEHVAESVCRIAGLVVTNAMIFQEVLSQEDDRVQTLQYLLDLPSIQEGVTAHWKFITDEINYAPIFAIARGITASLPSSRGESLRGLTLTAQRIVGLRAALRHDLMGRVYHRLLADAKYLGTYYTGIPAATLLLKLALNPRDDENDWHNLEHLRGFKIADLACGTGTLLMAGAEAITDNYVSACAELGHPVDLRGLHKAITEDILHGYDVLASAIHLTASTLALRAPEISFTAMNLYAMRLGGPESWLGSIDFLREQQVPISLDLSDVTAVQIDGSGHREVRRDANVMTPTNLDLCVMNPPFTRSVGNNLLFGSSLPDERRRMRNQLKRVVNRPDVSANITAGLGSVFVATAHPLLKDSGRLALVLPKALLSGIAWGVTRQLLEDHYVVEYIICSHDPPLWNFSESTALSEVLLVARKGLPNPGENPNVVSVNLWRNPSSSVDALATGSAILGRLPSIVDHMSMEDLHIDDSKVGEAVSINWNDFRALPNWMPASAFAQSDLLRITLGLFAGTFVDSSGSEYALPFAELQTLGNLGPDRRDVYDGFEIITTPTAFPAFWGRTAESTSHLAHQPNRYLRPLQTALANRSLRDAGVLWGRSGRVLIAEKVRLNTQSAMAGLCETAVLSNVWWPYSINGGDVRQEKALVMWLNSSLGLLMLLAVREETEGAWINFKKPTLEHLPVLDVTSLALSTLESLASAFDEVATQTLLPLPRINEDAARAAIDSAIATALDLPDYQWIRSAIAVEPVISLERLS
jgi:hypothetical protein